MSGHTNTSGGLLKVLQSVLIPAGGDRESVTNVVIIITDGITNNDSHLTIPYATQLKYKKHAVIFAVGVTDQVNRTELREMSSTPRELGKNYFLTDGFVQLDTIIGAMINLTCASISTSITGNVMFKGKQSLNVLNVLALNVLTASLWMMWTPRSRDKSAIQNK